MSGPDDPDAAYAAKILEFDEDEVDNYSQAVQSNFRSAINKNVAVLQKLLQDAGVERTAGDTGRYTRSRMARDLIANGVSIRQDLDTRAIIAPMHPPTSSSPPLLKSPSTVVRTR